MNHYEANEALGLRTPEGIARQRAWLQRVTDSRAFVLWALDHRRDIRGPLRAWMKATGNAPDWIVAKLRELETK